MPGVGLIPCLFESYTHHTNTIKRISRPNETFENYLKTKRTLESPQSSSEFSLEWEQRACITPMEAECPFRICLR